VKALVVWTDLPSALLRRGVEMAIADTEPDTVMEALETQANTWLASLETIHRMSIAGTMAVQAGKEPKEIAESMRPVTNE